MRALRGIVTGILLLGASVANAVPIFDNGEFSLAATQIQRNYIGPTQTMFEDFTLGADAFLNEIHWGGGEYQISGTSNITSVTLSIYDVLPGTGLVLSQTFTPGATFTATFLGTHDQSSDRYDYTISGLNLALEAGTTYWFGLSTISISGANWSNTVGTASTIPGLYQKIGGTFPGTFHPTENGAFQLYGTFDVPEPATLLLMGIGLAGLGFRKRKRA